MMSCTRPPFTSPCRRRSTCIWSLALLIACSAAHVQADNGEGFYQLFASSATEFLDLTLVDSTTLAPLPATFMANAQGEYALSGLIVLNGNTAEPLGDLEITGLGDPHVQTKATFVIPQGAIAVTGEQFFITFIAGISIVASGAPDSGQDLRIESSQTVTATGSPGTPPVSPIASHNAFLETADGKSTNANAGVSGSYAIPGQLTHSSTPVALPPLPADTTEDRFSTLVTQVDLGFFDIAADSDFAIDVTSRTDILPLIPQVPGDFNHDGVVNLADYPVWRDNLGALDESVLHNNGDGIGGVDQGDYDYWKLHFGHTAALPSTDATALVPEPSSIALQALAAMAAFCFRRKTAR